MRQGTCAGSGMPSGTGSHLASCCTPGRAPSGWTSQSRRCPSAPSGA